jgi:hypothetical protein
MSVVAPALLAVALPDPAVSQFRMGHAPDDLARYEWTAWLVGEWEGEWIAEGQVRLYRQSFQFSPDHRYIITHNQRGNGPDAYRGLGVFSYYPATGEAYGEWFGTEHDTNAGWAVRDGERMVWTIRRLGMRITRVRIRTGPDSYEVKNEVVSPDGATTRSREVMKRVAGETPPAPGAEESEAVAGSGLGDAVTVALGMPRAIDHADWPAFVDLFAPDAVMFFPFKPHRAVGLDAIAAEMAPIFESNRRRLPGPIFGFEPRDVQVSALGPNGAAVSWFMDRGEIRQRRSVALRRDNGIWRIVLVHADNWKQAG